MSGRPGGGEKVSFSTRICSNMLLSTFPALLCQRFFTKRSPHKNNNTKEPIETSNTPIASRGLCPCWFFSCFKCFCLVALSVFAREHTWFQAFSRLSWWIFVSCRVSTSRIISLRVNTPDGLPLGNSASPTNTTRLWIGTLGICCRRVSTCL